MKAQPNVQPQRSAWSCQEDGATVRSNETGTTCVAVFGSATKTTVAVAGSVATAGRVALAGRALTVVCFGPAG